MQKVDKLLARTADETARATPGVGLGNPGFIVGFMRDYARLREQDEKLAELTEDRNKLEDALLDRAEAQRVRLARVKGRFVTTLDLGLVLYVTQNKYRKIKAKESSDKLCRAFDGAFAKYFTLEHEIKVNPDNISAEAMKALRACGAVEVVEVLKPTEQLHRDRTFRDNVARLCLAHNLAPQAYFQEKKVQKGD